MKRIIKGISLFAVIILSLVFAYPSNTYALTEQTSFININNTESLEVGSLSFTNILFTDYSSTSTQAFGLTGVIANSSNNTISYTSIAYYYDSNNNLIAQGANSGTAISGTSNFNQMSNLSILNGHSINEIYYYRLSIETNDNANSSLTNTTSLTPSKNYQYSSYDYVIDKYDINIIVNENNTFDITETITAYFNVSKHGIFRTIPLKNTITRLDGTTSTNRTQVTNISVDNGYTTSRENGSYKLKIGSASRTLTGEQTYVIKYTYNLGKDPVKNYDELYYNIIGNEWDTVIGNITFTITMPKIFDSSKLGFSSGTTGSTDNSKVKYNVNGNKITGSYNGILGVGEALTVRCELPEGYFVGAGFSINIMECIMFLIPILFLIIALLLWYKFGRDEQVVETVEFYPPEGLNSLDVGFLFKGKANNQDVTSLLIYLANKGYIKIVETDNKLVNDLVSLMSKKKGFKIIKLKEYDGTNQNEKLFLDGLFDSKVLKIEGLGLVKSNGITNYKDYGFTIIESENKLGFFKEFKIARDAIKNGNYVELDNGNKEATPQSLYNRFYITLSNILSNINDKKNKDKVFEKTSTNKLKFIKLLIILIFITIVLMSIITQNIVFLPLLFWFGIIYGITMDKNIKIKDKIISVIVICAFFIFFANIYLILSSNENASSLDLSFEPTNMILFVVNLICIIILRIIYNNMPKRTKYGNEMIGKLKGFKNFLKTAEKEKLEAMVLDNPNYFYDILPFTYVLGVSNKWIKKFETISLQAPTWYNSPNAFDVSTFGTFVNSTMVSAQSAMSSSPSSDSGSGGSSGGGSSGGGSGGGGGGSW